MNSYEEVGNELSNRILALIPTHPEILKMDDAFDLFDVDGFKCDDLDPSMFQASWALANAKKRANTTSTETGEQHPAAGNTSC
jgi:hypothetical protein